jgi:hypothetical protein
MRSLFQTSVAYTLAFLISAGETPLGSPVCVEQGSSCSTNTDCCVGTCDGSKHCATPSTSGPNSCSATNPCPNGACVNGYCEGGTQCNSNTQCGNGNCQNGYCSNACSQASDCNGGGCNAGACCAAEQRDCSGNQDCCSGSCVSGQCQLSQGGAGEACSTTNDCVRGRCENGTCNVDCSNGEACGPFAACQGTTCCTADNSRCIVDGDCCGNSKCRSGACKPSVVP